MILGSSTDHGKVIRKQGRPPQQVDQQIVVYLREKLEETRKDCQWLIGLGAASVFGVILKQDVNTTASWLHESTLIVIGLQMFIALIGAMSLWQGEVDKPQLLRRLELTLKARYWIRNIALVLLVAAFLLLVLQVL